MAKPIEKFLLKLSVQTAVYWGAPTNDGYGVETFATAVEIAVRWQASTKVITTSKGVEYVSQAEVIVNQDVSNEGYMYLGSLTDLSAEQLLNPKLVNTAWKIMRFDKIPMIFKTDEFVRKCYL